MKRFMSSLVDKISDFSQRIDQTSGPINTLLFSNFVFNYGICLPNKVLGSRYLETYVNELGIVFFQMD